MLLLATLLLSHLALETPPTSPTVLRVCALGCDGEPLAFADVQVTPRSEDGTEGEPLGDGRADRDGCFSVATPSPGRYRVWIVDPGGNAMRDVEVGRASVELVIHRAPQPRDVFAAFPCWQGFAGWRRDPHGGLEEACGQEGLDALMADSPGGGAAPREAASRCRDLLVALVADPKAASGHALRCAAIARLLASGNGRHLERELRARLEPERTEAERVRAWETWLALVLTLGRGHDGPWPETGPSAAERELVEPLFTSELHGSRRLRGIAARLDDPSPRVGRLAAKALDVRCLDPSPVAKELRAAAERLVSGDRQASGPDEEASVFVGLLAARVSARLGDIEQERALVAVRSLLGHGDPWMRAFAWEELSLHVAEHEFALELLLRDESTLRRAVATCRARELPSGDGGDRLRKAAGEFLLTLVDQLVHSRDLPDAPDDPVLALEHVLPGQGW